MRYPLPPFALLVLATTACSQSGSPGTPGEDIGPAGDVLAPELDSSSDSSPDEAADTAPTDPDDVVPDTVAPDDTRDGSGSEPGDTTTDDTTTDDTTTDDTDPANPPDSGGTDDIGDSEHDAADTAGSDSGSADASEAGGVGTELGVLFVGNSYIYTNDLPAVFGALATEAGFARDELRIEAVTAGGHRLEQHAADFRAGARIATVMQAASTVAWDAVVLQEQSQIPGFPVGVAERDRSMVAVVELAGYANAVGANTVLFQTWGYRVGDARNAHIFGDYPSMQTRLTSGYAEMGAAVAAAPYDVAIAGVGEAFRLVWNAAAAAGDDAPNERLFASLYSGDNSHPARAGTYLAACVLLARIADVDVRTLDTYNAGIPAADRDLLQEYAMQVVSDDR